MALSEKIVKETVDKNRRYLDALEGADKQGRIHALRKIRKTSQ